MGTRPCGSSTDQLTCGWFGENVGRRNDPVSSSNGKTDEKISATELYSQSYLHPTPLSSFLLFCSQRLSNTSDIFADVWTDLPDCFLCSPFARKVTGFHLSKYKITKIRIEMKTSLSIVFTVVASASAICKWYWIERSLYFNLSAAQCCFATIVQNAEISCNIAWW